MVVHLNFTMIIMNSLSFVSFQTATCEEYLVDKEGEVVDIVNAPVSNSE